MKALQPLSRWGNSVLSMGIIRLALLAFWNGSFGQVAIEQCYSILVIQNDKGLQATRNRGVFLDGQRCVSCRSPGIMAVLFCINEDQAEGMFFF